MFFFLSKTLNYLVQPLVIIAAFFLASALVRATKWKRRAFIAGLCLLFFFSNDFIANEYLLQAPGYTVAKLPDVGYVRLADDLIPDEPGLHHTRAARRDVLLILCNAPT